MILRDQIIFGDVPEKSIKMFAYEIFGTCPMMFVYEIVGTCLIMFSLLQTFRATVVGTARKKVLVTGFIFIFFSSLSF